MKKKFEKEFTMFDFLYNDGFTASPYQQQTGFRNWVVYLVSEKIIFRINQDRGEMYLSLAAPSTKVKDVAALRYIALSAFIGFYNNDIKYSLPAKKDESIEAQLTRISNILREYYGELCSFFEPTDLSVRMMRFDHYLNERREYTLNEFNKIQ